MVSACRSICSPSSSFIGPSHRHRLIHDCSSCLPFRTVAAPSWSLFFHLLPRPPLYYLSTCICAESTCLGESRNDVGRGPVKKMLVYIKVSSFFYPDQYCWVKFRDFCSIQFCDNFHRRRVHKPECCNLCLVNKWENEKSCWIIYYYVFFCPPSFIWNSILVAPVIERTISK